MPETGAAGRRVTSSNSDDVALRSNVDHPSFVFPPQAKLPSPNPPFPAAGLRLPSLSFSTPQSASRPPSLLRMPVQPFLACRLVAFTLYALVSAASAAFYALLYFKGQGIAASNIGALEPPPCSVGEATTAASR